MLEGKKKNKPILCFYVLVMQKFGFEKNSSVLIQIKNTDLHKVLLLNVCFRFYI